MLRKQKPFRNPGSVARIKAHIVFLNKQESAIKREITEVLKKDEEVNASMEIICTIPGVAKLTAATVLAETNGFELIRNKRQLTSYAGLDVRENNRAHQ